MGQDKVFQNIRWALIMVAMASVTAEDPLFRCDFETGDLCGMEQWNNDDFNWTRHSGRTPTDIYNWDLSTGPREAISGTYYIYIETSDRYRKSAYISTPAIQHSGDICVRFYYSMYGEHIGRLVVFTEQQRESNAVWSEEGDKGGAWLDGQVTVKNFAENDKVVFLGQAGNGNLGDIAIDDVRIHAGECSACQINNGGCDTLCVKLEEYPHLKCECHHGYRIESDFFKCVDIDECREGNDGCSNMCRNTPGSYQCQCPNGYSLAPNNRTCEETDECLEGNGGCSDQCLNTVGSYHCQCPIGYSLAADNRTCAGGQPDNSQDHSQVIVAVMVVVLAVIAFAVGVVVYIKRRRKVSQAQEQAVPTASRGDVTGPADVATYEDVGGPPPATVNTSAIQMSPLRSHGAIPAPQEYLNLDLCERRSTASYVNVPTGVYYENDAAFITRPAGDVTEPAGGAAYDDVRGPAQVTARAAQIQMSAPRSDPKDSNPGGYEHLESYEPHVGGPYDVIM